jgi:formylglycine-generating enzyme required for sulfatase activity
MITPPNDPKHPYEHRRPYDPEKTCPHCGAPPKNRTGIPSHFISALLALAAAFFFWTGRRNPTGGMIPSIQSSGGLSAEKIKYLSSPEADKACGVCLASADNFMKEKRLAAIREKTKRMALLPAGEYTIGSPEGRGDPDERPRHRVYLDAFFIDKYETTLAEYMEFAADSGGDYPEWAKAGSQFNLDTGSETYYRHLAPLLKTCKDCPIIGVSAKNAEAYCKSRNKRLPTEAEWEAAARGGTESEFSFGDDPAAADNYSWNSKNAAKTPHPVGQKKPNGYGLYDVHGNVWEWTSGFYEKWYYKTSPARNPGGAPTGEEHVIRGGSWAFDADSSRTANRATNDKPNDDIGFRCAVSEAAVSAAVAADERKY